MNDNMLSENQFMNLDMESGDSEKQCSLYLVFIQTFLVDPFYSEIQVKLRLGFIQKVYGILLTQLGFTTLLCLLSMVSPSFSAFQQNNIWLLWVSFIISFIVILNFIILQNSKIVIAITCFKSVARQVPTNYILLFGFTLCEGYLVSFICSFYNASIVLMAASLTTAMVLALTLYACFTKTDFTMMGGILCVFMCLLLCFGILTIFVHTRILNLIYCVCGVFLFSIYLIYDTQLVMGKFQQMYSLDDYIIAALQLYLDIINIFLYILEILGNKN